MNNFVAVLGKSFYVEMRIQQDYKDNSSPPPPSFFFSMELIT